MAVTTKNVNASLSTMWAINNFSDLGEFFQVARQLGFHKVELNHQVNSAMLSGANLDHTQFSSVHEPCPADIPMKKLVERDWLISSTDEEARLQGVEAVKNSIRLAHKLGAASVVVHCGNVSADMSRENALRGTYKSGEDLSEAFQELKNELVNYRMELVGPRLRSVKKSLSELIEFAAVNNITLGLENRYHYMDIPILEEMEELLSLGDPDRVGFVYDTGHAEALSQLGFFPHAEWLRRYSSRMIGAHLHDVQGLSDHYAPGLGKLNFKLIGTYLPGKAFRTLELQPGNTLAQIKNGIDLLLEAGCISYL